MSALAKHPCSGLFAAVVTVGAALGCSDPTIPRDSGITVRIVSPVAADSLFDSDVVQFIGEVDAPDLGRFPEDSMHWGQGAVILGTGPTLRARLSAGSHTLRFFARYGERVARRRISVTVHEGVGRVRWTVPLDTNLWDGVTMGPSGELYAVDGDQRTVVAIRPDGTVRWRTSLPVGITGHPGTVGPDGTIYWGHVAPGRDGGAVAVNPDGSVKWVFYTKSIGTPGSLYYHVHGGLALGSNGDIFFVSEEQGAPMYALRSDGTLKWRTPTRPDGSTEFWSFVVLSGDSLALALQKNDSLVAVATSDGSVRWTFPGGGGICQIAPAIAADGSILIPYLGWITGTQSDLVAVGPDGALLWRAATVPPASGSPIVGEDRIFLGARNGGVDVLDARGTPVGTFGPEPDVLVGGLVLGSQGITYVVIDGWLVSYDAKGDERFSTPIPHRRSQSCNYAQGGPIIGDDGTVYVRASDGGVYAIADTVGPAVDAAWPNFQGGRSRRGRPD